MRRRRQRTIGADRDGSSMRPDEPGQAGGPAGMAGVLVLGVVWPCSK